MANIEAYRTDVPLYQVVEHIVGDLDPLAALQRSSKIAAWDHALKDLIDAVSLAKLKARGRLPGSQLLEAISSGDFAEVADNPHANFDLTIEYGGKRVLEFNDTKATIVKSHSIGPPKVMLTDVCAESGAEILKIWPAPLLAMANLNAADGVRESEGNETTEHGFDFDAARLAEVMPRLQGDAGPPEVGTNDTATTPTKEPSRKVLWAANELKRLYPDGLTMKTFQELGEALKTSKSTVKRAFSCNGWSRTRAKPTAK